MAPQDTFIEEEEETCPLCIEEFDLSDKNFRPCPCGYQICQFCFNNIRNNQNGLCPACRRPYSDDSIQWKVVTPEEMAQFKAAAQKTAKKKQELRQKEVQKKEVENLNRKHLSGLRVVQKNLVYVMGLNQTLPEQELYQTLRGEKYFGQYGKINKIVVSSSKKTGDSGPGGPAMGVYVTFESDADAQRCIAAVNGSQNGDRTLRAQLGTTKYCSAYLRNEVCTNKNCMFLHEPGDNDDSYSRQDLSSINSASTQRPLISRPFSSASGSTSRTHANTPSQHPQPTAAATQSMHREASRDGSDSGDGSALPTTAHWATRGTQPRSRRGSLATSGAASSPAFSHAMPATEEAVEEPEEPSEPVPEPPVEEATPTPASEITSSSTTSSKPARNPALVSLLRDINSPSLTFSSPGSESERDASNSKYPPLFDQNGGEKRRIMREAQEEESRLQMEQDPPIENEAVAEPVEEEEPERESGSFQLGGEPEDMDNGRDGRIAPGNYELRRPSMQLPIQRNHNGSPFGGALSQQYQTMGVPHTVNGRHLTAQQQQHLSAMKSNAQAEQYQQGMASQFGQGSLFQGQGGHNRQSSRFNFANDGSSNASSVKPSAKAMAQQSSMMPSGSHAQGGQFYGSSMPGPPPGLKSATPPVGGMFGFGGSMFGGPPKENNEIIREMMRRAGDKQQQQQREFNNSPLFLHQYPSASSTPVSASSGFMAQLYGPQTGAYQDFNQKQKKKGKKHRHANTSSSGGGGLVDLVDPSILQARHQHQQQSNAGVGQGLFGGQAQEPEFPDDDEAIKTVDQLVAESEEDNYSIRSVDRSEYISRASTPSIPPGFGPPGLAPSILAPPGFGPQYGHPPLMQMGREEPISKPLSKIVPTSAPFTPGRSTAFLPRAATPLSNVSVPTTPPLTVIPLASAVPTPETAISKAKQEVKALATKTGLSAAIAAQPTLQAEDFPALDNGKGKSAMTPVSAKATMVKTPLATPSKKAAAVVSIPAAPTSSKASEKRATAGLNISVPSKPTPKPAVISESIAKPVVASSAFPPLPTSTPVPSAQSPIVRQAPKTLRLVPTPKTETPPAGSVTPSSTTSMFPASFITSRQVSLSVAPRMERPGTPTSMSELISDNASVTSASISRPNSPPPNRVGSAPVRTKTKSMLKKERKEKLQLLTEMEVSAPKPEPEVEIAPIMGRKKKVKKERPAHSAAGGSTPAVSRPQSPRPVDGPSGHKSTVVDTNPAAISSVSKQAPPDPESVKPMVKNTEAKSKGKGKAPKSPTPDLNPSVVEAEEEIVEKPTPTPATVFQELLAAHVFQDADALFFLKPPVVHHRHQDPPADIQSGKLTITPEDRAALLAGLAVHKVSEGPSRIMLTPNGDCVRNLTPEEEMRYLDLQSAISEESGATAFVSPKHHANNGFTLIGGRAVPNGPPSFFPIFNSSAPPMDPVSKIQRDEALSYINQYVLPSLSTNSQLEKALNANALDPEILRSGDPASWATWETDPTSSHPEIRDGRDGMLGLEHMTAAFAVSGDNRGQPLGNVSLLSLNEAESAMQLARKETDGLEKRLNALIKKNRRLLLGSGH